jgi:hypothetical protein
MSEAGAEGEALLERLEARFHAHPHRHPSLEWAEVLRRVRANPAALPSLAVMERTGGEPDVVDLEERDGLDSHALLYIDCAEASPCRWGSAS